MNSLSDPQFYIEAFYKNDEERYGIRTKHIIAAPWSMETDLLLFIILFCTLNCSVCFGGQLVMFLSLPDPKRIGCWM